MPSASSRGWVPAPRRRAWPLRTTRNVVVSAVAAFVLVAALVGLGRVVAPPSGPSDAAAGLAARASSSRSLHEEPTDAGSAGSTSESGDAASSVTVWPSAPSDAAAEPSAPAGARPPADDLAPPLSPIPLPGAPAGPVGAGAAGTEAGSASVDPDRPGPATTPPGWDVAPLSTGPLPVLPETSTPLPSSDGSGVPVVPGPPGLPALPLLPSTEDDEPRTATPTPRPRRTTVPEAHPRDRARPEVTRTPSAVAGGGATGGTEEADGPGRRPSRASTTPSEWPRPTADRGDDSTGGAGVVPSGWPLPSLGSAESDPPTTARGTARVVTTTRTITRAPDGTVTADTTTSSTRPRAALTTPRGWPVPSGSADEESGRSGSSTTPSRPSTTSRPSTSPPTSSPPTSRTPTTTRTSTTPPTRRTESDASTTEASTTTTSDSSTGTTTVTRRSTSTPSNGSGSTTTQQTTQQSSRGGTVPGDASGVDTGSQMVVLAPVPHGHWWSSLLSW